MPAPYRPYIPQTTGELWDLIGGFMLMAPKFEGDPVYFPGRNIETGFNALNGGIATVRKKIGEDRYAAMMALSARMRALFEADPEDRTGDAQAGRQLILEMEEVLRPRRRVAE